MADAHRDTGPDPSAPRGLFVYGTLMQGECRGAVLDAHGVLARCRAKARGLLLDLGEYPGMVLAQVEEETWVQGEFVLLEDIEGALLTTDAIEDFRGFDVPGSLFVRSRILSELADGSLVPAWTYLYARATDGRNRIVSGDWRTYRRDR